MFDLLPDPNHEKKELYGVDLNDPDKRRVGTVSNRVAANVGAMVTPTEEAMEKAEPLTRGEPAQISSCRGFNTTIRRGSWRSC